LPAQSSFPQGVTPLNIRLLGNERILSPSQKTWNSFFLNGLKVSDYYRHYMGKVAPVKFVNYEQTLEQFQKEWQEIVKGFKKVKK
jgi:virulence-associated protein VagC